MKSFFSNLTQAQAMLLVGLITVILGGILTGYVQLRQTQIPIEATQTAEAKQTLLAQIVDTQTPTPTPTATIDADPTVYDNFNNPAYDGELRPGVWKSYATSPSYVEQQNGVAVLSLEPGTGENASLFANLNLLAIQSHFIESKMLLSGEKTGEDGDVGFGLVTNLDDGQQLIFLCLIYREGPQVGCEAYGRNDVIEYFSERRITKYDTWHTVRIEMDSEINVTYYVDDKQVGTYRPDDAEQIKGRVFTPRLQVWSPKQDGIKAHFDDVRIGQIDE